jgi:hypothetical protein
LTNAIIAVEASDNTPEKANNDDFEEQDDGV